MVKICINNISKTFYVVIFLTAFFTFSGFSVTPGVAQDMNIIHSSLIIRDKPLDHIAKVGENNIALRATPIPLSHQDPNLKKIDKLSYLGGLQLSSPNHRFGGISGLVISPNGEQILGVSDKGWWFLSNVIYDNNQLQGLENSRMQRLQLGDYKYHYDAEAITAVDSAGFVVSFEGKHRMSYYQANSEIDYSSVLNAPAQVPTFTPDLAPILAALPQNLGVEALTTLQDGRMLAISESTENEKETHDINGKAKAWLVGRGKALPLFYDMQEGYRPTDMATLPCGDVLILERHFSLSRGLASRLRRVKAMDIQENALIHGELIADLKFPLNLDNMEALAVRQNDAGETLIYIMSDNNYNRLQRTLLMMFKLDG